MKVRGSRADIAMECAGSLVPTETPYSPTSDEANSGTAKHEALAFVARGEEPQIDSIAERYGVDADEISLAVNRGREALSELDVWLPNRRSEVKLEGPVTTGTADILSVGDVVDGVPASMSIVDWKSGWSGDEHPRQLMAYADASRAMFGVPASGCVTSFEVHLAKRDIITRNFSMAQLDGFRERIAEQIRSAEIGHPQYAAGGHCKFCPRQHQCPARDDYLRATVVALEPLSANGHELTREVLGELYDRSKMLVRALRAYDQALDDALEAGPITLPDGRLLQLVYTEKDKLDGAVVAELLVTEFGFSSRELSEALSATKSGIERAVKSRVAKGGASAEMRKILCRLREAGAVTKTTAKQKEIVDA